MRTQITEPPCSASPLVSACNFCVIFAGPKNSKSVIFVVFQIVQIVRNDLVKFLQENYSVVLDSYLVRSCKKFQDLVRMLQNTWLVSFPSPTSTSLLDVFLVLPTL